MKLRDLKIGDVFISPFPSIPDVKWIGRKHCKMMTVEDKHLCYNFSSQKVEPLDDDLEILSFKRE